MIFVEPELNSFIINEEDFKPTKNYIPDIMLALRALDPDREIHFAIDIKEAPAAFIVYMRQLRENRPNMKVTLYLKNISDKLKLVLDKYKLNYKNITEYPWDLPNEENVVEKIDPFKDVEGWDELQQKIIIENG
jgi:hypothetical protein